MNSKRHLAAAPLAPTIPMRPNPADAYSGVKFDGVPQSWQQLAEDLARDEETSGRHEYPSTWRDRHYDRETNWNADGSLRIAYGYGSLADAEADIERRRESLGDRLIAVGRAPSGRAWVIFAHGEAAGGPVSTQRPGKEVRS